VGRLPLIAALALSAVPVIAAEPSTAESACPAFTAERGGPLISTAFGMINSAGAELQARSSVNLGQKSAAHGDAIVPPACLRRGDWLWIRPLRLNPDEYLILQKCDPADCTRAQVVRAWNFRGYMGPYPVPNERIPIEDGARYLLWMQHVHLPGGESFSLIERYGKPFVFDPVGHLVAFSYVQRALQAARARGPQPLKRASPDHASFVATFAGGSLVRMQALRPVR
jgi:hypothetical protein